MADMPTKPTKPKPRKRVPARAARAERPAQPAQNAQPAQPEKPEALMRPPTAPTEQNEQTAQTAPTEQTAPAAPAAANPDRPAKPYPHPIDLARSANMKGNRRTDTKPELALRSALHALGYRYRKDFRIDLPQRRVRPDIAFTRRKVAVFVDGCFWHACPEHGSKPKNNEWYWSPKLARNVERDRAADDALVQAGWTVVRLWEHVPVAEGVAAVIAAVGTRSPTGTAPAGTNMNSHADLPAVDASGAG